MGRFKRHLPTLLLALLAAASGFSFYADIMLTRALTDIANGLGGPRQGYPSISWDQWFQLTVCLLCVVTMIILIKWKELGRGLSLVAFGASLAYATIMATLPDRWLVATFSTQLDRQAAALAATMLAVAFGWLALHRSGNHSHHVGATL